MPESICFFTLVNPTLSMAKVRWHMVKINRRVTIAVAIEKKTDKRIPIGGGGFFCIP